MSYEKDLANLFKNIKNAFDTAKIQDFLLAHQKLSQLYTKHIQEIIDEKNKITQEINFNVDDETMEEIKTFNDNMVKFNRGEKESTVDKKDIKDINM